MSEKITKTEAEWRELLSPEQYRVAREHGTEPAFSGNFWDHKGKGVYRCVGCNDALFTSDEKFDSGSGWPSYTAAIEDGSVVATRDTSHGMVRTEVSCGRCESHLGHVFDDGPAPTGKRYCINSASLTFDETDPGDA